MSSSQHPCQPRCAALVGSYLSGKTTLLESLLSATGSIPRKGSVKDGSTVGDATPEARARKMSVEVSCASADYLGEQWCFLDCPGSVELLAEAKAALMVADVAIVVVEPEAERAAAIAPIFKFLDDHAIPHMVFINKIDELRGSEVRIRDVLGALQAVSARPLVLRQVPIRDGEAISGYVDLVSSRAYRYKPGAASELIQAPDTVKERQQTARQELLEALADFDDSLLEQLLEDTVPDTQDVYGYLSKELAQDLIVPVFLGSAERDHGVRRLLKALRHETPEPAETAKRLGIEAPGNTVAQIFKTYHAPHTGKLSFARVWRGQVTDGMTLGGQRVSGISRMMGLEQRKIGKAEAGTVVALGRMEAVQTGDILTDGGGRLRPARWPEPAHPVYGLAVSADNRNDEVKLSGAIAKLTEEDGTVRLQHNPDTGEWVLWGQGDIHLQLALEKLRNKYRLGLASRPPQTPYKETIRKGTAQHARFKRQTGGHGQFADVHVDIKPLPRGSGFEFVDKVVGGAIPRNFIPAVETGAREYCVRGPLGFPVIDVSVTLKDGQFHAVDSSEMAFKTAGRMAMSEALPNCDPVLLEPIMLVTIAVPNEFTSRAQRLVTGRRGQILGYDAKEGWKGWDEVKGYMPQSEMHDLIIELRSMTAGLGTYTAEFDHLTELTGRPATQAIEKRQAAIAHA